MEAHHRADDREASWLDDLVRSEMEGKSSGHQKEASEKFVAPELGDRNPFGESIIDKIAADSAEGAGSSMDDIEKRIDSATSIEELDKLEDELKGLQGDQSQDTGAGSGAEATNDPMAAEMGTAPQDSVSGSGVDQKLDAIEKKLDDDAKNTQEQMLVELKKLNESMGNDKMVDLNNTIDPS